MYPAHTSAKSFPRKVHNMDWLNNSLVKGFDLEVVFFILIPHPCMSVCVCVRVCVCVCLYVCGVCACGMCAHGSVLYML